MALRIGPNVPVFPRQLLRETSHSWNIVGAAATPGQTGLSVAPLVRTDGGGFWSCQMSDVSLGGRTGLSGRERQRTSTLLWRAVRQIFDNGARPMVVWRNDTLFRPWPVGVPLQVDDVPHSDGTFFDDGTGYAQPLIDIVTYGDAALRATALVLEVRLARQFQGGESFSVDHPTLGWRLYEIATVKQNEQFAVVTFNPPLRESVPGGTRLEFDRPRCIMRLATPNAMDLSVRPWSFNTASVDLVEAFV